MMSSDLQAMFRFSFGLLAVALALSACGLAQRTAPPPPRQNPSPMVEHTRTHVRLPADSPPSGVRSAITGILTRPIHVFVPDVHPGPRALLVHFNGAAYVGEHAVARSGRYVLASVQLAAGSRAYEEPFRDPAVMQQLLEAAQREASLEAFDSVVLSAFSAGYGAIRAILRDSASAERIDGVVLLDGLHTSYVPEARVLHEGGRLDTVLLQPFEQFARAAVEGHRTFVLAHSEIFPGTFASTTETADWLIGRLGRSRTPVLRWGALGMQQLSEVCAGRLVVQGFAGNAGPDHIDHLHALYHFLALHDSLRNSACRD
jgi:hypothetical protein